MSAAGLPSALARRYARLRRDLAAMDRVLVAFSGGVDSTLLLKTASDVLGNKVLAVTASAEIHPRWEVEEAAGFARKTGVKHKIVRIKALAEPGIAANPPDRCYHCKRFIFSRLLEIARREDIRHVLDGTNADDRSDFRPGERALRELGIESPLRKAGLTKKDIRRLSAALGLPTAGKPSYACLASRFPYHTELEPKALGMVEAAEKFLAGLGFRQSRVRHHGPVARIEVEPQRIGELARQGHQLDDVNAMIDEQPAVLGLNRLSAGTNF